MIEMANAFVLGFNQIFTWVTFGLMTLGILIGFAVGILPGLGGPTALALMLPFIVKMDAVQAFAFLIGMAAVTNTTGDITSILVGVPGEPTSAATIVDGHPMAKKGEAGRALGAALMSSLVGGIFGALALALAIPIVRPLVLTFGSPEFFMLAVLGITFVASLSGEVITKGLITGGIGLFLSTVGLCQMSGIQRFTLGQIFLWDGIGLVPITIGFFAFPEIIDLAVQGTSIAREKVGKIGGVMEGVKDTFRHFWLTIRCSAIGTYLGIIPGMGAATTQWLAYAHAVQSSPDKERFGKGAVEGVLGPGASNNSALGGSLVTAIAFGVPSSVITAILLGAFLIQGIVPGPDMLIPAVKGGHLDLTFSFVWINIIANTITVLGCFFILNQLVKVTYVRGSLLTPLIILLIYLGAFAEKNAFPDLILVLFFGVLGWVLVKLNWPRPPLILGLVLGPMAENRLFLSTDNYGAAWLIRPGVLILMVLILAGFLYPFLKRIMKKREIKEPLEPLASEAEGLNRKRVWRFSWEMAFCLFIIFALVWALWESIYFDIRSGLFPWVIGIPVLSLTVFQLTLDILGKEKGSIVEASPGIPPNVVRRRTASTMAWLIGFFLAIWLFGFTIGVPLCTFMQLKFGSKEKWLLTLTLTAFSWVLIYVLFERLLYVPFPTGELFLWLQLSKT